MPFDEDIDPLTGNRKVHKHNAEKSKTPTSKISINPKLTIEQTHKYEDLLVQNIRHKSKELGIKLGNRNKVGFGSTIPITLGKETGFIIISFSSTRYNDDKSNFMAYRKNIMKSNIREWEEIKKVSLDSISNYYNQVDNIIEAIKSNTSQNDLFHRQFTTKPFQDSVEITVNNPEKRSIETYILDWEEVDALEESLKNAREQAQKTYGK